MWRSLWGSSLSLISLPGLNTYPTYAGCLLRESGLTIAYKQSFFMTFFGSGLTSRYSSRAFIHTSFKYMVLSLLPFPITVKVSPLILSISMLMSSESRKPQFKKHNYGIITFSLLPAIADNRLLDSSKVKATGSRLLVFGVSNSKAGFSGMSFTMEWRYLK